MESQDVVNRRDHARQLSDPKRRVKSSGRRGDHRRVAQERREEKEDYENRKELNTAVATAPLRPVVTAPLPPRRKKSNFHLKKRSNKVKVVTVDRYKYENEDGSITWGYQNDDGGFKVSLSFDNIPYVCLIISNLKLGCLILGIMTLLNMLLS